MEHTTEQRNKARIEWAKDMIRKEEYRYELAQLQVDSLKSPAARSLFLDEQSNRHDPGYNGYSYDRRRCEVTEKQAEWAVGDRWYYVDAAKCQLRRQETNDLYYMMSDELADVLIGFRSFPQDDTDRTYYTKKRMPRMRKLKAHLDCEIPKNGRGKLWSRQWPFKVYKRKAGEGVQSATIHYQGRK